MSERETILDQAMKAFVAAHRASTLASVAAFIQNYPAEEHEAILDFIEEYLETEAELAMMTVDPTVLTAVDTARQRVLEELSARRVSFRELRRQAGLLPAKIAQLINLPTAVVGHLASGRIILASLTRRQSALLIERLAAALHHTQDEIAAALRTLASAQAPLRMSAEDDTTLTEEPITFADALEQSPSLTPEMRTEWLDQSTTQ